MKIYIMRSDTDNYDCLSLVNKGDFDELKVDGRSLLKAWIPIPVKVYRNSGVLSDSPGFSPGIPVLNQKAITPSHIFFYQL
jgi:hypothetical protein